MLPSPVLYLARFLEYSDKKQVVPEREPPEPVQVLYKVPPEDVETVPILMRVYDSTVVGHERLELRYRRVDHIVFVDDSDDDDDWGELELSLNSI